MTQFEFKIDAKELTTKLEQNGRIIKDKQLKHIHESITEILHTKAVDNAPVDKGTLKKTSHVNYLDKLHSEVVFPVPYAVFMEFGTGVYVDEDGRSLGATGQPIRPKTKQALAWTSGGGRPTSPEGWHEAVASGRGHVVSSVLGSHPTMFMRKALEWVRANLRIVIDEAVRTMPK